MLDNNKFIYHLRGLYLYYYPKIFLNKDKILKDVESRADYAYIKDRLDYYNKLDSDTSRWGGVVLESKYPRKSPYNIKTTLASFKLPMKNFTYFFDSYEYLRYFNQKLEFILEKGDVNYNLLLPCICKSRPIDSNNINNILLNLDKVRHFKFIKDKISYEDKDDILYFRGGAYQKHRIKFLEKYFLDSRCDLGHTGSINNNNKAFYKPKANLREHLRHKFILSLEGNDVASNLKWIMSSNSIAVMPKPKFETWFMEGRLIGDFHYIQIDDEYDNIFDKLAFYKENPMKAKAIINNANAYCKQFFDKQREKIISLLVLEKYFKYAKI